MERWFQPAAASPYFDGAIHGAGEEPSSLDGQTGDTALMTHQSLGTRHVLHVPHLGSAEKRYGEGRGNEKCIVRRGGKRVGGEERGM